MIPKKIHYCWFGRGEKPELIKKCIESWRHYLVDYQIIEWNEDNFDVNSNTFTKQAYEQKKYAFVSDYVRLKVLYDNGGIYMDTDVEVLKPFPDIFLENKAFSGFESITNVPTGIMACEKSFKLFGEFMDYYKDKSFIGESGNLNSVTNVDIITNILVKYGLKRNNTKQTIREFTLYPKDYFCPLEDGTGIMNKTDNTYTIHWFSKTWWDKSNIKKYKRAKLAYRILGKNLVLGISRCKKNLKSFLK